MIQVHGRCAEAQPLFLSERERGLYSWRWFWKSVPERWQTSVPDLGRLFSGAGKLWKRL